MVCVEPVVPAILEESVRRDTKIKVSVTFVVV